MPTIPLSEAMVVWTANRAPWLESRKSAPAGSIAVVHWPDETGAWGRYPSSVGACDQDWQEGDDNYRLQRLADLIGQLGARDNMNMEHVAEALKGIEGIERISAFKPRKVADGE